MKTKANEKKYVLVRTESAGVFCGYIESRQKDNIVLSKARRIWYWTGAASLSQLAMEGVKTPDTCKFPCEVDFIELYKVIEVIPMTEMARQSVKGVKVWQQ